MEAITIQALSRFFHWMEEIKGSAIYQIVKIDDGWHIQWWERSRIPEDKWGEDDWRNGLVIYDSYPSLAKCIAGEMERVGYEL